MVFKAGEPSGNPKGRPKKGQATADLLRAIGELRYQDTKQTYRERAGRVIWEQACKGNLQALQWIVERTEGKVADKVDATVNQRTEHVVSPDTVAAVLAGYALRGRPGAGSP